jgi:hypothetical protein
MLDPDPDSMNPDPKHCVLYTTLIKWEQLVKKDTKDLFNFHDVLKIATKKFG